MKGYLWNRLGKIKTRDLLTKVSLLKAAADQLATRANCALIVCAAADTEAQSFLALKPAGGEAAMLDHGRFALFLPDAQDAGQLLSLARTLTVKLGGSTKVYAGIAQQSPGDTAAALLAHAELALSAAQKQGVPGYGFLDPEVARMESRRAAVMKVVENAAAANAFNLEFQPVYGMRTGALDGFEALIRLRDSGLGNTSPPNSSRWPSSAARSIRSALGVCAKPAWWQRDGLPISKLRSIFHLSSLNPAR